MRNECDGRLIAKVAVIRDWFVRDAPAPIE